MASIKMRKKKNGARIFDIRVMSGGEMFRCSFPARGDMPIPDTWSDKRARTEAEKAAVLFEAECKRGAISHDKRTFSEYATYVLELKQANNALKPSTLNEYRLLMPRIDAERLGTMKLKDISAKDLNAFYIRLSQDGANKATGGKLSSATIRKYHAFISSVLNTACKEQIISFNPAMNATPPKLEQKEANFYDADKMASILEAISLEPVFWQALTYVLIGTGARRGEISGLRWSDIDFNNRAISIQRNIIRTGGGYIESSPKTGTGRVVSVPDAVLSALQAWKREQADIFGAFSLSGYVFANHEPMTFFRPDNITQYYGRFGARYKLGRVNPHAFRHWQASMILQGGDIVMASRRLGHSRTSTTLDIYGHLLKQNDRAAADKVGTVFDSVK